MAEFLAHSGGHKLVDHLEAVAHLSADFARAWPAGEMSSGWAYLAGLWHDLGKYRPGFQRYVVYDPNAHIEGQGKVGGRDKTHSAAGALWAIQKLGETHGPNGARASRVLAYLIASHHAGLYDWESTPKTPGLSQRLSEDDCKTELQEARDALPPERILSHGDFVPDLRGIPGGSAGFSLWVRLLFSCLVDADFLDTEAHFDAGKPARRDGFPTLDQMRTTFDAHMAAKAAAVDITSTVNPLRADVLRQCRDKSALPAGFFSLTVPTGGGKTLSSLAFALNHAQTHGQHRVIYAIPYTSIIEQTAEVFREVFKDLGDEVLIEHHSQADAAEKDETARSRLACENWDAPLIVTTNVQLFESLFAAKTSRCRKLHNLVNSVIVLDEAQQLPPEFLQPILDVLNLLVKHYGVTVVFCTATQPALSTTDYFDASKNLHGPETPVREIIDNPDALFDALKRVDVQLPEDWNISTPWTEIATQLAQEDCVLAIVSTRKAARELHRMLPRGTLHLSALMCGAHRKTVIDQIKARLKAKREGADREPLRVVSTQLVEAGVDIDFPVVYRALAGLDSIAQAAGRCNREGLLDGKGRVVVFVPPELPPVGHLRKAAQACVSTLHGQQADPLARALFATYFRDFYSKVELDSKGVCKLLAVESKTLGVQFRSAAEAFRLIDDEDSATVVVRYAPHREELEKWLATLASEGPKRWLMRKLQRYTVSIHQRVADKMLMQGDLTLPMPGLYVQKQADNLYDPNLGLKLNDDLFNPGGFVP